MPQDTQMCERNPSAAVRRAAIMALSECDLVDGSESRIRRMLIEDRGGQYTPTQETAFGVAHATSLVAAYAVLTNADYEQTLAQLVTLAKELRTACEDAKDRWTELCQQSTDQILFIAAIKTEHEPALAAYAAAADVPYQVACELIARAHARECRDTSHHPGWQALD